MGRVPKSKPVDGPSEPSTSAGTTEKGRQWRELQVVELVDVFSVLPPIGKPSQDGQMKAGGAKIAIWEPIAAEMNKRLPQVNKAILEKKPEDSGKLKEAVTADECKHKFDAMQKEYRKVCRCELTSQLFVSVYVVVSLVLVRLRDSVCSCRMDIETQCARHSMQLHFILNTPIERRKRQGYI